MTQEKKTVLFIEDDQDQRAMYGYAFKKGGFRYLEARNGRIGLEVARAELPDIILLDILMDEMSGIETLKELKNDSKTAPIPVVIFTNYAKEETLKQALELGAKQIVIKTNVVPDEMVEKVMGFL